GHALAASAPAVHRLIAQRLMRVQRLHRPSTHNAEIETLRLLDVVLVVRPQLCCRIAGGVKHELATAASRTMLAKLGTLDSWRRPLGLEYQLRDATLPAELAKTAPECAVGIHRR